MHYFGLYEILAMTLHLTDKPLPTFCRSSSERLLGSVRGHYSVVRTTGSIWILGATDGRWLHGILTTGLDGGSIIGLTFRLLVFLAPVVIFIFGRLWLFLT